MSKWRLCKAFEDLTGEGTRLVRCRDVAGMKETLRRTVGWLKSGESGKFLILAHGETRQFFLFFPDRKLDFNLVTKKFHD